MAREPQFLYKELSFSSPIVKVDRNKVYGWTDMKYLDDAGKECHFVTIMDDGRTMIGTGGVALKAIDENGNEIDKSSLIAFDQDGSLAELKPSVFDGETVLDDTKTIEDYLDLDVKSVYQLNFEEGKASLLAILQEKKVLYFKFNYRPSYEPDDAFLVSQGENIFIVTGHLTEFEYSSLQLVSTIDEESDTPEDEFDFSML